MKSGFLFLFLHITTIKKTMNNRKTFLWGCMALAATGVNARQAEKPNILFILCDDMGYGDLGCYGQRYIRTPHIDRMASEGMRFTQAYAGSPVSAPSRASLMTGQHTGHTEVRGNKEYWKDAPRIMYGNNEDYSIAGQHPYDPGHIILPEVMKNNGYTTGLFGKWAGGYEGSASTPDKRGVDEFYGYICQFQAHLYNLAEDIHEDHDVAASYPDVVEQLVSIIRKEHRSSKFFKVTLPEAAKQPLP